MKNILKYLTIVLMVIPLSCSDDFLDKLPTDQVTGGAFAPERVLTGAYGALQEFQVGQNAYYFDGMTPISYNRNGGWRAFAKDEVDKLLNALDDVL